MNDIIFSQIPLEDLMEKLRVTVREEIQATKAEVDRNDERPITIKELCEYLGVSEPTIMRWRTQGKIPFFNIGTSVRFNLKEVLKALSK